MSALGLVDLWVWGALRGKQKKITRSKAYWLIKLLFLSLEGKRLVSLPLQGIRDKGIKAAKG